MIIKVLGSGCKNCKKLLENVKESVKELNIKAEVLYITDMMEIANSGLMRTPGLIFDNKIVSSGKVPSTDEIKQMIENFNK
ncbi:MAG: thioredoxin family protein [Candidatus Izemoplasmatales bacterium]|jgi:small redox-active disulfide protein 2|nr:thioredoxin family protein [Candidatus Izemoplasmatales bacterium]